MKLSETFQMLEIRNQIIDQKLPIKTAYKFTRFFEQLEKESKFFNDTLQKIVDEYGQRDENGNFILTADKNGVKIKEDKFEECMDKIEELNNIEVQLSYIPQFTLEELDSLNLEVKYIQELIPYIIEE